MEKEESRFRSSERDDEIRFPYIITGRVDAHHPPWGAASDYCGTGQAPDRRQTSRPEAQKAKSKEEEAARERIRRVETFWKRIDDRKERDVGAEKSDKMKRDVGLVEERRS